MPLVYFYYKHKNCDYEENKELNLSFTVGGLRISTDMKYCCDFSQEQCAISLIEAGNYNGYFQVYYARVTSTQIDTDTLERNMCINCHINRNPANAFQNINMVSVGFNSCGMLDNDCAFNVMMLILDVSYVRVLHHSKTNQLLIVFTGNNKFFTCDLVPREDLVGEYYIEVEKVHVWAVLTPILIEMLPKDNNYSWMPLSKILIKSKSSSFFSLENLVTGESRRTFN